MAKASRWVGFALAVCAVFLSPRFAVAQSAIKDGDRIVFVGDSITGQGAKGGKSGWIALIGEGLSLVRPNAKPTLIGLGGSGSTVGAWLNHEKNSRTKPVALDVKEIDVGQTLDAGAEIVVVMLGMNDVLAPTVKGDAESFDGWIGHYAELIDALRARSHPRVIAVATVTPCTEDPTSPKNRALAEMNGRLRKFAAEKGLLVLPTGEASWEVQALGRMGEPEFQVTGDYVHPRAPGHLAIAVGMLRGLGEETAAARLLAQYEPLYHREPERQAAVAYTFQRLPGSPDDETQRFIIDYRWPGTPPAVPAVTARVPAGWKVTPASLHAEKGRFEITGPLDRLANDIVLVAAAGNETREQRITIPAGWRIAVGRGKSDGWMQNTDYDPAKDRQPLDEKLAKGEGLTAPVAFPVGEPAPWQLYVASKDFTGLNYRTGSVDFAAIAFFSYGQQAYGARWIYSERERPVSVNFRTQTFAGMFSLGVWLNGQPVFAGKVKHETAAGALHRGWNLLLFRSNFIQWQWQFAIELAGHDGDDLADLRYATKPPAR
jgi:lysophospholipase L1-like esterase